MVMVTRSGFSCPSCGKDLDITTKGLLGGIIQQLIAQALINKLRESGGTVTCGHCNHKWRIRKNGN